MLLFCGFFLYSGLATVDIFAQTEPRLVLPIGHTGTINTAVFSPDGKYVLTASRDHTARIYEVSSGKELHVLTGHTSYVSSAVFSPDGKYALTASWDKTARIYELSSGKTVHVLPGHKHWLNSAVFSPDAKYVLTASNDKTARIYEVASEKELHILSGHKRWVNSAVFSLDGKHALTASQDGTARIYEVASGMELQVLLGHTDDVESAVFSPNAKYALTASRDGTARIFEVSSGKELQVLSGHTSGVVSAVFSPDGKYALTASLDKTARIYEVSSGKEVHVLSGHNDFVTSAGFSPDGKYALTASSDKTARMYEAASGKELHVLSGHTSRVTSAGFSLDGKYAITASDDKTARIHELSSGKELQFITGYTDGVWSPVFSPDGKYALIASSDSSSRIFEVSSGKELHVLTGHTSSVYSAVFSPDGKYALTASWDKTARIYELSSGKPIHVLRGHLNLLYSAVFSPDGKYVLTASLDSTERIYEVSSGRALQVFSLQVGSSCTASFSPDGKYVLTASLDSAARIYDVSSGRQLQLLSGHTGVVMSAVFSPDGKYALTASSDKTARIYEVSSGKELYVLSGHTSSVTSAVFSPDGKFVLTASSDSTARIHEVSSGKELHVLSGHTSWVTSAVFSPDGKYTLTASWDQTARIHEWSSGKLIDVFTGGSGWPIGTSVFSPDGKHILTTGADHKTILWDASTGKALYTRLQLKGNDWLVYDEHYRFDGTPGAIEKLYFVCGLEPIDLAQMKDSLWVPGLAEKIINKQDILINDKPAPKLSELNICELTPVIEPIDQEDKRMLKYRITPRNGGLGNTEVYINGNLTFSIKPEQLVKGMEDKKEVYYLTLNTDTLQEYLMGEKKDVNPVLVKCKVKGTGIYGRGVVLEVEKTTDEEEPHFYGVFIGVDEYGNPQKSASDTRYRNLDFAAKDAQDLSVAVEQTARNLFKDNCHIYRLTGTGNDAPTKENLQRVLADVGSQAKASDVLYIFFAGHGDIRRGENEDGQPQDQIRFMLMNADKINPLTWSFGVRELSEWCSPRLIKAQKRVFVFDACHSGKITQEAAGGFRGDDEGTRIRQLDKLKDKNGMMILAAAADDESAYEDETLNQGVLTYHLLQVMKEEAKDTSLVVRDWFDETIDLVKEYSRLNGNKQEPSSFGDGRFEIGNVRDNVRNSIKITCPKTRVGACVFVAQGQAKLQFPNVKQRVNEYFASKGRGDQLIYSKNADRAYRTEGLYLQIKDETQVTYDLYRGEELAKSGIELPLRRYNNEDELVQAIVTSIALEIEALSKQDERCKLMNK